MKSNSAAAVAVFLALGCGDESSLQRTATWPVVEGLVVRKHDLPETRDAFCEA